MSIALLPLDDRPVSYLLPKQIADFSGINLILPERKYLSSLTKSSDLSYLDKWLNDFVEVDIDQLKLIISLDDYIYGGLVQSRKHSFSLEELRLRAEKLKTLNLEKYAFSSIMRIPSYDSDEEEKSYWKDYGSRLFNWSSLMHRVGRGILLDNETNESLLNKWYESAKLIPPEILSDFKGHRDKNFSINMRWLDFLREKHFEYLIFSCDDSAIYGMNVIESEYLEKSIKKLNLSNVSKVMSGTDEIPLVLMTKAILKDFSSKPFISILWGDEQAKDNLAKYESGSIYSSVMNQINTLDLNICEGGDVNLLIHVSSNGQGDHIFKECIPDTKKSVEDICSLLVKNRKPFILLDLAYANGGDPLLTERVLELDINWDLCYGYAGWNTCANSTGSALAIGLNRWMAEKKNKFDINAFKKCLLVRFLDDYAYQSKVRYRGILEDEVQAKMLFYVDKFLKAFNMDKIDVKFSLPWNRSFEVEIDV